jgi:hypothetical protein
MLVTSESIIGAFLLTTLYLICLVIPLHIIYFLHLLSTNHKCTQPCYFFCYSNLLLRRRWWTGILRRWVLGYASPRLPFPWCYGVFRCSVSHRVVLVFKRHYLCNNYTPSYDIWLSVTTFGHMCGTSDPVSCIRWVLSFGIKTGYDNQSHVNTRHEVLTWFRPSHGVIGLRLVLMYYAIEISSSIFLLGFFGGLFEDAFSFWDVFSLPLMWIYPLYL